MSDQQTEAEPKKKGMLVPLLAGLVLAVAAGAGGFFAVSAGLIGGEKKPAKHDVELRVADYVPLEPFVVSIGEPGRQRHLRFTAQLEVEPGKSQDVAQILPRITDVLNGYLRAINLSDVEDPAALVRIRAQMLRRVQILVGEGVVGDLLVMEFVLS